MSYHRFYGEEWFETFYMEGEDESGWYWWTCKPGMLPTSLERGPFGNEKLAIINAKNSQEGMTEGITEKGN
jgi:hypothetical protein